MLCLVQFFPPYQDGHKNTNHSKLNDNTCADFMALRNWDGALCDYEKKRYCCFKVHFHKCCQGPGSAYVQMLNWGGSESTLMYTVLVRIHKSFQKFNALANFWSWFWWDNELLIYESRLNKCSSCL